jgi:uncharacterized protein (DUF2236 family)
LSVSERSVAADYGEEWSLPGPGSLSWRVGRESVLLLGGGRALILQVAQPQVAAGVGQFSDYRHDPWGRIYRTIDVTLKIVFGDPDTSRAAAEQLRRRHQRIRGLDDRGEPYKALDPDLLLWVQATLIDTSLLIYERYVGPLTEGERELYFEEMKLMGEPYGIPRERQPADYAAFRRYYEDMLARGLRVTETLRDVTDAVLRPELPFVARPAVEALRLVTVGHLPPSLRAELDLGWGPWRERLLRASAETIRRMMPLLPGLLRYLPAARAAERREAAAPRGAAA